MYPISTDTSPIQIPVLPSGAFSAGNHCEGLLKHFGFRETPFGVTPNPAFLFSSRMHLNALQSMIQSIESNLGFTVLLGDPGMGKTTLLFQLLSQYRDSARTAFIFQTQCKRYELLRYLASELELSVMKHDEVSLHQRLKEMLVNEARAGRKVLIFIDEGQNLHHTSLEAIRLLSDFETPRAKLLHIIMAGSSRLGETLLAPELSQLAQRISTICRLAPLLPEEVKGYVIFRLRTAECRVAESLFSADALSEIADQSEGVPRMVNSLCYRSLSLAYAIGEHRISSMLVRHAARDLDLAHSAALNFNAADNLSKTSSFPAPVVSREKHAAIVPAKSGQDLPEPATKPDPATKKDIPFRPVAMPTAMNTIPQAPSLPAQDKAIPETQMGDTCTSAPVGTRRYSPQYAAITETHRLKSSGLKNDRSALVLIALIVVALGLWGYELRNQPRATKEMQTEAKPITDPAQSQLTTSSSPRMPDSQIADEKSASGRNPIGNNKPETASKTHVPAVHTLQQSLLPSKINAQPAPAVEAAPPATPNISGVPDNLTTPLATGPTLLPASGARVTDAAPTAAKQPPHESRIFLRQPTRVVEPKYPKLAELRHIEGDVLLELRVDSQGKVQQVRTISGNSLLSDAAEEAVRQWRYPPYPEDQLPTPAVTRVRFTFKLDSEARK